MPLVFIVHAGQLYDSRALQSGFLMGLDGLIIAEIAPAEAESRSVRRDHPLVIKIDNIAVGAIVDNQGYDPAHSVRKLMRKFQYISDRRATEAVQALIVVSDNTDVLMLSAEQKYELLLNVVRILILVNHDIVDLRAELGKYLRVIRQEPVCLGLNGRKVHQVVFGQHFLICFQNLAQRGDADITVSHKLSRVDQFF